VAALLGEIDAIELLPPLWRQTVHVEQWPIMDSIFCLNRSSMAEAILFDTSERGLLEEDVSDKRQMGDDIWVAKRIV